MTGTWVRAAFAWIGTPRKSTSSLCKGIYTMAGLRNRAANDIAVSGGNVIGRWSHTISENSDFKLQLYYDRTDRNIPGTFGENLDTYDVDFQHRFSQGKRHDIVWGLGYRLIDDNVSNSTALAFLPPQRLAPVVQRVRAGRNRAGQRPAASDARHEDRTQRLHRV